MSIPLITGEVSTGELMAELRKVEKKAVQKVSRDGAKKGAFFVRGVQKAAWRAVDRPKTKNKIYTNVTMRPLGRNRKRGIVVFRGGVVGGAKDYSKSGEFKGKGKDNRGGDTFYWRFLEHGFTHTSHGKKGAEIAGRKIFKKHLLQQEENYKAIVVESIREAIFGL